MRKTKTASRTIQRGDRKVARETGKQRDSKLVGVLGAISEVGDQPPMIALGLATLAGGAVLRDGKLARTAVRMLAAHALATAAKSFIKHRVDRTRPHAPLNGGRYRAKKGSSSDPALNSFPSGHTAGAVAVAGAVASQYPQTAPAGFAAAGAIAAMQLPRAQHYVSDIVAGALIGGAAAWLTTRVFDLGEQLVRAGSGPHHSID